MVSKASVAPNTYHKIPYSVTQFCCQKCSWLYLVEVLLYVHRNHRLIRDGEIEEKGAWRWGKREIIYLSLHCHHQNDSCIKMGSDKSHFNVSLIVRDKVTRQCPQTTVLEEKGEPKRIRTKVLLLTSLTPYR